MAGFSRNTKGGNYEKEFIKPSFIKDFVDEAGILHKIRNRNQAVANVGHEIFELFLRLTRKNEKKFDPRPLVCDCKELNAGTVSQSCEKCLGTGFEGGFIQFGPVRARIQIADKFNETVKYGQFERHQFKGWMGAPGTAGFKREESEKYPLINEGDVLIREFKGDDSLLYASELYEITDKSESTWAGEKKESFISSQKFTAVKLNEQDRIAKALMRRFLPSEQEILQTIKYGERRVLK